MLSALKSYDMGREIMDLDKKRISVSQKRQITIPQKFFEMLNIGKEVECFIKNNSLVIKPVRNDSDSGFAVEILRELVEEKGLSGSELLQEFERLSKGVRPAIEAMLEEADNVAKKFKGTGNEQMLDIFGDD